VLVARHPRSESAKSLISIVRHEGPVYPPLRICCTRHSRTPGRDVAVDKGSSRRLSMPLPLITMQVHPTGQAADLC
jgi:hypothetical protein